MTAEGRDVRRVSTGKGRCTCSYFFPDGKRILYASTHLAAAACPPRPDYSRGYVWALYDTYEIFTAARDGSKVKRLTNHPGYDAEATISEDGKKIIFTSLRDGDVDLYTMNPDGSGLKRITHEPGYDGGAFFSPDGKRIVYRASRPRTPKEIEDWNVLLKDHLVRPTTLEIQVANADGSGAHAVTSLGAASFAPSWFRDGKRIIFASNYLDPKGRNFDLFMINDDGTGLERVTYNDTFDGFPLFSPEGKRLVFASNRNAAHPGDTNIFVADWVP
jgi:TolB protein